jgi:acetyl-CoA carboxylase biotin carboxyl carrier protein
MDLKIISELIKMVGASNLSSLEVESKDLRVKLEKNLNPDLSERIPSKRVFTNDFNISNTVVDQEKDQPAVTAIESSERTLDTTAEVGGKLVKSPIVGTFYSSSSPDKDPFVTVGKTVKKGDTLCIIEAMKLMNEIDSEFDGEVVEILVQNGAMVEYGQPLFRIK